MSTNDRAETHRDNSIDWLLGIRFFLLSFTIAGILGSAVTVSWWARQVLDHLAMVNRWISDVVSSIVLNWFNVQIGWQTKPIIPITLIFLTVISIGLVRGAWQFRVYSNPVLSVAASLITVALLYAQVNFGPRPADEPAEIRELRIRCMQAVPLSEENARCRAEIEKLIGSPWEYFRKLTLAEWVIAILWFVSLLAVVYLFPAELIAATIGASLFLGLGLIDFRPLIGPS